MNIFSPTLGLISDRFVSVSSHFVVKNRLILGQHLQKTDLCTKAKMNYKNTGALDLRSTYFRDNDFAAFSEQQEKRLNSLFLARKCDTFFCVMAQNN
jgi:hypothetical protein